MKTNKVKLQKPKRQKEYQNKEQKDIRCNCIWFFFKAIFNIHILFTFQNNCGFLFGIWTVFFLLFFCYVHPFTCAIDRVRLMYFYNKIRWKNCNVNGDDDDDAAARLNGMQRLTLARHGWCCRCSRRTRFGHRSTRQVTNIVVDRPLMFGRWLLGEALPQFSCMPNPIKWNENIKIELDLIGMKILSWQEKSTFKLRVKWVSG